MSRKVKAKELDKSKIKLQQEEISRSVNQNQIINERLKSDNLEILEEINKKQEEIKIINK